MTKKGDTVEGFFEWKTLQVSDVKGCNKIKDAANEEKADDVPLTAYVGPLGLTGRTAYYGLFDVAKVKLTDNVLVSGNWHNIKLLFFKNKKRFRKCATIA